jgi:hypothetical protein
VFQEDLPKDPPKDLSKDLLRSSKFMGDPSRDGRCGTNKKDLQEIDRHLPTYFLVVFLFVVDISLLMSLICFR